MSKTKHPSLFIRNHPTAPQLSPELAKEIGLNESILLLQWEYWMRSEAEERDGHLWLRKTEREIQRFFSFWSTGSIHRIVQSLISKGYMVAGSHDTGPGRGAQWLRFDWDKISTLKSIRVDCSNLEQRLLNSEPKSLQVGATDFNINKDQDIDPPSGYKVPKKPAEPKTLHPPEGFQIDSEFETWMAERFIDLSPEQQRDALEAWHDSRRSDPAITKPRTMEQWRYDLKKFIRIYWQNAQPRSGNGHNGHGGVVNEQPMMTIKERMRLGLL